MIPLFTQPEQQILTEEQEQQKRAIYDKMNPRRRKFVDRIGYDAWNPFQKPNDPLDMRMDVSKRTTQQLIREFYHSLGEQQVSNAFRRGAFNAALGVVNQDEEMLGACAFFQWYDALLQKEGSDERKI